MAFGTRVAFEGIRELDFGDINATFVPLGLPFLDHTRVIGFNNSTNREIYISLDGITNNLRIAVNSFKLFDLSANKVRDDGLFLAAGTQVFVKYVSTFGTSGSMWIEIMHADGGK